MKSRSRFAVLLVFSCIGIRPASADFKSGLDAYQRKDYATAMKEWKPLAENGDSRSQACVGTMYATGAGVRRDYREARRWLGSAAAQGNEAAKSWLVHIAGRHDSFSTWLLRLSLIQLVKFFAGIPLAGLVIFTAYVLSVTHLRPVASDAPAWEKVCGPAVRIGVFGAIAALYCWGSLAEYRVARNLGASPDAATVSSLYSWFPVGVAFSNWLIDHRNDPLGQTLSQFEALL
jgi:hypothetical protein